MFAVAKQFTPVSPNALSRVDTAQEFLRVATATLEVGMQEGSLIRSSRKRGPDVWQFRWADRGPYGKRIYRKRVIGTVWQYPEADSARKAVSGLLREIGPSPLRR